MLFDHFFIEVGASLVDQVFESIILIPGFAVGAVRDERVPGIHDGEDTR